MKFFLVAIAALLTANFASAQVLPEAAPDTLDEIIREYDALILSFNPAEAAIRKGRLANEWPDATVEGIANRAKRARDLQTRLANLQTSPGNPDVAILNALLTRLIDFDRLNERFIPFTGDSGFHSSPTYTISRARISSADDAYAVINQLRTLDMYFDQHIENMRDGLDAGVSAHSDPLATTRAQIAEQIVGRPEDSPLFKPFQSLPDALHPHQVNDIRLQARSAVMEAVAAYETLDEFFEKEYQPREEPGIVSLPGGQEAYAALVRRHTTRPDLTPQRVHEIGLAEVARIKNEMVSVISETGFEGTFSQFLNYLRTDPKFYADTPEALIAKASEISKRLDASLPQYFGKLPRLPYGVSPVPAEIAPGYTTGRYVGGDLKRGVAGTYLVNTYALDQRPLYELPALSAHEAVPGHHLQISLAQELEGVSEFRNSYYATAFGEGWGLYAERLAGEAGIYQTPYERFGALSYEMWRACRLVADTGLHWYGWSRAEAEKCFTENSALAPLNIKTEVTRYIGWPGQALGYKIGEITIRDLRDEAKAKLGDDFDIRVFHDVILGDGAVPLPVLEQNVRRWIASQSAASQWQGTP